MRNRNFGVGGGSLCVLDIVGYQSGFSWEGEVNYVRGMARGMPRMPSAWMAGPRPQQQVTLHRWFVPWVRVQGRSCQFSVEGSKVTISPRARLSSSYQEGPSPSSHTEPDLQRLAFSAYTTHTSSFLWPRLEAEEPPQPATDCCCCFLNQVRASVLKQQHNGTV